MNTKELNDYLGTFKQPQFVSDEAWNNVLDQAKKVWENYLSGMEWKEALQITCVESYLMLVTKEGKLIVENDSLLNFIQTKEVKEWRKRLEHLAFEAISLKRFDKAERFFTKAIKVERTNAVNHYRRGLVRMRLLNNKEALLDFSNAIELNPNISAFYLKRAQIYRLLDLDYKAMSDLNKAIKIEPENPEAFDIRGKYRLALGDKAGAKLDLNRSKALQQEHQTSGRELYGKLAA